MTRYHPIIGKELAPGECTWGTSPSRSGSTSRSAYSDVGSGCRRYAESAQLNYDMAYLYGRIQVFGPVIARMKSDAGSWIRAMRKDE